MEDPPINESIKSTLKVFMTTQNCTNRIIYFITKLKHINKNLKYSHTSRAPMHHPHHCPLQLPTHILVVRIIGLAYAQARRGWRWSTPPCSKTPLTTAFCRRETEAAPVVASAWAAPVVASIWAVTSRQPKTRENNEASGLHTIRNTVPVVQWRRMMQRPAGSHPCSS